jgi:hypothetical protein
MSDRWTIEELKEEWRAEKKTNRTLTWAEFSMRTDVWQRAGRLKTDSGVFSNEQAILG